MRIGLDGVCDVSISIVTHRDARDCSSTFSIGHRGCTAEIPLSKNEAHMPWSFAPQFKIIHGAAPSLYGCSEVRSDCLRNSLSICGRTGSRVICNPLLC